MSTKSTTPKYPSIHVQLTGRDGNAFGLIGAVGKALKRGGVHPAEVKAFYDECEKQPSYEALLAFLQRTADVS